MMRKLLLLILALSFGPLQAQVSFKAVISRDQVSVGQRFTIEFKVNQQGQDFNPPSFQGFKVLGGPNTSYSSFMDNRGTRLEISYGYVLKAIKEGDFTIGPAFIKVDGETYRTEPVKIRVNEAKQNKQDGQPDLAFAKVLVNKTEVYQGEPIYASYRIYYREGLGLQPLSINSEPDLEGFYKEDIEVKRFEEDREYFNGLPYGAGNLREMVVIPQRNGQLNPGPLMLTLPVSYYSNQRDAWNFRRRVSRELDLSASFPSIKVKPLPLKGKPQNFSGAVGSFKMNAELSSTEVDTDGSIRLRIRIEGSGNIKFVDLPKVEFPSAFEVFDPEIKESSRVGSFGMRGYKEIEYLLVPRYKGTYKVKPIVFSFFNTKTGKYERLESETFEIMVSGDSNQAISSRSSLSADGDASEEVDFLNKDILFIKTKAGPWKNKNEQFLNSRSFFGFLISTAALILSLIALWYRKRHELENYDSLRMQRAGKMARKKLQKAQKALKQGDAEIFYAELETAILGFFSDKLQVGVSTLNKDFIRDKLQEKNCAEADVQHILDLLSKAEMARFTGIKMEAAEQDYQAAQRVLTEIEKQLWWKGLFFYSPY